MSTLAIIAQQIELQEPDRFSGDTLYDYLQKILEKKKQNYFNM